MAVSSACCWPLAAAGTLKAGGGDDTPEKQVWRDANWSAQISPE